MIRQTAITDALKAHLADMPDKPPVAWENQDSLPGAYPYLIVTPVRGEPARVTHDGVHRYPGLLQVAVVVAAGTGTRAAYDLAETVAAHFYGADLTADGGQLRITDAPQIMDGYTDGARFRVPVLVRYSLIA